MLTTIRATIDEAGNLCLLDQVKLPVKRHALVTVLPDGVILSEESNKQTADTHISNIEAQVKFPTPSSARIDSMFDIQFTHPRSSKIFTAEVGSNCTGERAIEGLLLGDEQGPFLEPAPLGRPYQLCIIRSHACIRPNQTFAEAGVVSGDVIEIRQDGQGAGSVELQELFEIVMTSGVSLAILKTITSIATQLIGSRKKTVEFQKNGVKYKLTMNSSVKRMIELVKTMDRQVDKIESQVTNNQAVNRSKNNPVRAALKRTAESRKSMKKSSSRTVVPGFLTIDVAR
jgi:hypothetical protein